MATIVLEGVEHTVGDEDCSQCWSDGPLECTEEDCSGLLHTEFGDENYNGDYWLYYLCDVCGSTSRPI
jgi:hypothetical protein